MLEIFFFNLKNLNILIKIISFDEIVISYLLLTTICDILISINIFIIFYYIGISIDIIIKMKGLTNYNN